MDVEDFTAKLKKLVEEYGWVVIIALIIALMISVIVLIRERNKNRKGGS
ncbi:MAG: hypothetical protein ACUVTB_06155 [Candidatus Bathycorpusculaceae bacterium]